MIGVHESLRTRAVRALKTAEEITDAGSVPTLKNPLSAKLTRRNVLKAAGIGALGAGAYVFLSQASPVQAEGNSAKEVASGITLRDFGDYMNVPILVTNDGANINWNTKEYEDLVATNFNGIMTTGCLLPQHFIKYGDEIANKFRKRAKDHQQVFMMHPGVYLSDLPSDLKMDKLKDQKPEDIKVLLEQFVRDRAQKFLGIAGKPDSNSPILCTFLGEQLWWNNGNNNNTINHGYSGSLYKEQPEFAYYNPFFEAYNNQQKNQIAEVYSIWFEAVVKAGFNPNTDFVLGYSEYDCSQPGKKTDFVLTELKLARQEATNILKERIKTLHASDDSGLKALGDKMESFINYKDGEVRMDMFLQEHMPSEKYRKENLIWLRPNPTPDKAAQVVELFQKNGFNVHATELNVLGKDLTPQKRLSQLINYMKAFVNAGCSSITLFNALAEQTPKDANTLKYHADPLIASSDNSKMTPLYNQMLTELTTEFPPPIEASAKPQG